jgi:hypothetical protein
MLGFVRLNVVMLSVVILSVVILSVVILSVVASGSLYLDNNSIESFSLTLTIRQKSWGVCPHQASQSKARYVLIKLFGVDLLMIFFK